jgi:hypothetical protein
MPKNGFQRWFKARSWSEVYQMTTEYVLFVHCLGEAKHECSQDVAWLPVSIAGEAMVDFLDSPTAGTVHLINPKPVAWRILAAVIATEFDIPLVPYTEWLYRLEHAANTRDSTVQLRASRLLPFFRSLNGEPNEEDDAFGFPKLNMNEALASSQSLRDLNCRLEEKDVKQWIKYWHGAGLL